MGDGPMTPRTNSALTTGEGEDIVACRDGAGAGRDAIPTIMTDRTRDALGHFGVAQLLK